VEENHNATMISIVATHPCGEVVGHYALEQRDMPGIFEGSSAVVNPVHRGRGLLERMRAVAIDQGRKKNLRGLIFLPWTVHVYSQKANEHFKAHLVSINLGDSVPITLAGVELDDTSHRVSTVLYYTPLQPRQPCPLHVPAHLRDMVERILRPLDGNVTFADATSTSEEDVKTVLLSHELPHDRFSEMTITTLGTDAVTAFETEFQRLLLHERMACIFLNVPMHRPGAYALIDRAERQGFGFIGVGPSYCDGVDALRLAFLIEPLDAGLIHIYSDFGKSLLDFAMREQERVTALRVT
jgi:hypothetical protein